MHLRAFFYLTENLGWNLFAVLRIQAPKLGTFLRLFVVIIITFIGYSPARIVALNV